jgi:hypothetical protein
MATPRYLTKPRLKLAIECSAKPFYTDKRPLYPDTKIEESFLAAMAEGGCQVGDPTKLYLPDRRDIGAADCEPAPAATGKALARQDAVIDNAAVHCMSSTRKRREAMLNGSGTRLCQSLSSVESSVPGLPTWCVD